MKSKWWLIAFSVCLLLAIVSPLASSAPDGLDRLTGDSETQRSPGPAVFQIAAGYAFPGIGNPTLAVMLAGVTGVLLLFGIAYGLTWLLSTRSRKKTA